MVELDYGKIKRFEPQRMKGEAVSAFGIVVSITTSRHHIADLRCVVRVRTGQSKAPFMAEGGASRAVRCELLVVVFFFPKLDLRPDGLLFFNSIILLIIVVECLLLFSRITL